MPFLASFFWANDAQKSQLCTLSLPWDRVHPRGYGKNYVEKAHESFFIHLGKIGLSKTPLVAVQTIAFDPRPLVGREAKLIVQFEIMLETGPDKEHTLTCFTANPRGLGAGNVPLQLVPFQLNRQEAERWSRLVSAWADPLERVWNGEEATRTDRAVARLLRDLPFRAHVVGQNLLHSGGLNPFPGIRSVELTRDVFGPDAC